jgi:hypothetical protein
MSDQKGFWKVLLLCMTASVFLAGCLSMRRPLEVKDNPVKTAETETLTASLRYLDDAQLRKSFKPEVNPFLTNYNTIQLRRIMTFELAIENHGPEEVGFILNRLELQYAGKTLKPYNRFQLVQEWVFRDGQQRALAVDKTRREKIIDNWVLPNTITIPPGGKLGGFIVFIGTTAEYGLATVYVPVLRSKEEELHRFEFQFQF